MAVKNNSGANQSKPCLNTIFQAGWYLCMASDPLYAEDEMELTSSEINLPHNLDEMASPKESTSNMSSLDGTDCCDTGTKIDFLISSKGLFFKVSSQRKKSAV